MCRHNLLCTPVSTSEPRPAARFGPDILLLCSLLRPHVERAFEQPKVSIDFAGFSGETLHGVIQEPLDKIRVGQLVPESIDIRILIPDTSQPCTGMVRQHVVHRLPHPGAVTRPGTGLREIIRNSRHLLLAFDGPICSICSWGVACGPAAGWCPNAERGDVARDTECQLVAVCGEWICPEGGESARR